MANDKEYPIILLAWRAPNCFFGLASLERFQDMFQQVRSIHTGNWWVAFREIRLSFGEHLEWEPLEAKLARRVAVYRPGSIQDSTASLEEYEKWFIEQLLRFKAVFGPRLPAALAAAQNSNQSAEHILLPAKTADCQM